MPESSLAATIRMSLSAQEPWPDNVKLFQPYEVEQILLPDNASCLAVQAFLKMCNLPFEVEMRWNAEFMSPSGRVPFIKCGAFVISELEPIVQFAANKGVSLCTKLSTEEKAEMRAYMSLITNVLVNAELYVSWLDTETYNTVTKTRNSSVYPWPLGWLQTRSKRAAVTKRLKALHWHEKTIDQVLSDVEQCCNSLSQRLGDKDFFFGTPTPLDALLYGHTRALLAAVGPKAAQTMKAITTVLLRHAVRVAGVTNVKLTPQEDTLIAQALMVTDTTPLYNRNVKYEKIKGTRTRVNLPMANVYEATDVFGFKPFASKQIVMMVSNDGAVTCQYNGPKENFEMDQKPRKSTKTIDDVTDKNDEFISSVDYESGDKNDFEVIYPNTMDDLDLYVNVETNINDFLDTIEEKDTTDSISQDTDDREDVMRVINAVSDDDDVNDVVYRSRKVYGDYDDILDDVRPTELDALVFGHVFTIITTRLPCRRLAETVRRHESLVALAKRIDERYFKRP